MASEKKTKSKGKVVWWIVRKILFPVLIAALLAGAGWYAWKVLSERHIQKLHTTLETQVQKVAELTVLKNTFTDVVSVKATRIGGLAKAYSIVKYRGIIRVGIADVTRISIELSEDGKSAVVHVPASCILGNDIETESLEVFDEKKSVFVPIGTQEIFDEIRLDMQENEALIKAQGGLADADIRVHALIESMVKSAGIENVKVLTMF